MYIYLSPFKKLRIKKLKLQARFNDYITKFDERLHVFEDSSLVNWNNNKDKIKIKFKLLTKNKIASFNQSNNTIYIRNMKSLRAIYHELLHAASSKIAKSYRSVGFHYKDKNIDIGNGLNEGYTELLTRRYFKANYTTLYGIELHYAKYLEMIIGREQMERYYLKADIESLINYLTKYDSINNIFDFLYGIDKINYNIKSININDIVHLNRLLLSWYLKKLKDDLFKNRINEDEFKSKSIEYMNNICDFNFKLEPKKKIK